MKVKHITINKYMKLKKENKALKYSLRQAESYIKYTEL